MRATATCTRRSWSSRATRTSWPRRRSPSRSCSSSQSRLGGSVSGEHGLGLLKRGRLERQWSPRALDLHEEIKRLFDPKNLLNPGKKLARRIPGDKPVIGTRS